MKAVNIDPEKEPIPASWVPRTIKGGKDGDPPEPPFDNKSWLEKLQPGTVFVAAPSGLYGYLYELIFKGETFYLLHQYQQDGITTLDMYVLPGKWCSIHKDYEILRINPPIEGEIQ